MSHPGGLFERGSSSIPTPSLLEVPVEVGDPPVAVAFFERDRTGLGSLSAASSLMSTPHSCAMSSATSSLVTLVGTRAEPLIGCEADRAEVVGIGGVQDRQAFGRAFAGWPALGSGCSHACASRDSIRHARSPSSSATACTGSVYRVFDRALFRRVTASSSRARAGRTESTNSSAMRPKGFRAVCVASSFDIASRVSAAPTRRQPRVLKSGCVLVASSPAVDAGRLGLPPTLVRQILGGRCRRRTWRLFGIPWTPLIGVTGLPTSRSELRLRGCSQRYLAAS